MGSILVTGSSGHIGRNLLEWLVYKKTPNLLLHSHKNPIPSSDHYNIVSCDLTNEGEVRNLFKKYDIDKIIHCAAHASPSYANTDKFYDLNIKATQYLLDCCKLGTDLVYLSTVLVYGSIGNFYETDKTNPDDIYGITKVASESLIDLYYRKGKIRPRILRLCGSVGPYMTHGKIFEASKVSEVNFKGKKDDVALPILHVSDIVRAIGKALYYNKPYLKANICNDDSVMLDEAMRIVNPNIKINYDDSIGKKVNFHCYTEVAYYELNWRPSLSSEQAIYAGFQKRIG